MVKHASGFLGAVVFRPCVVLIDGMGDRIRVIIQSHRLSNENGTVAGNIAFNHCQRENKVSMLGKASCPSHCMDPPLRLLALRLSSCEDRMKHLMNQAFNGRVIGCFAGAAAGDGVGGPDPPHHQPQARHRHGDVG